MNRQGSCRLRQAIALGLALVVFLGTAPFCAADPPALRELERQRGNDVAVAQVYAEREKTLAAELLQLDILLSDLRSQQREIEGRLAALEEDAAQARAEEEEIRKKLALARKRLGRWLCYLYENGNVSLIAIILDAESVMDLINRGELVSWLIDYEARLIREVQTLDAAIRQKLADIYRIELKTRAQKDLLDARIAQAEETQGKKSAMLESLRAESGDLLARIVKLEQQWYASLTTLHTLLKQLDRLFIREMKPDRVYFANRRLCVEVSASTINEVLKRVDPATGTLLTVRVTPGGLIIAGRSENSTSFSLSGKLVAEDEGTAVRFVPTSLLLAGTPVQKPVLQSIARDGSLFFQLDEQYRRFAIDSIKSDEDKLIIALRTR
ncbi:coiled-coil domain-containing protein [Desulforudis sp. DRI-14]